MSDKTIDPTLLAQMDDARLTPHQFRVYAHFILTDSPNRENWLQIAEACRMSVNQVVKTTGELNQLGLVVVNTDGALEWKRP